MKELVLNNVTLGYEKRIILKNLSFDVEAGDYLCILGENGSGKSTLIKTILKLCQPLCGSISFNGLRPYEIGYLPQQTITQRDFPASVNEIVLSGCLNKTGLRPFYSKNEKSLAADNMKKLNIENLAKRCYSELSGGQQQRVLLARALCATTKMLLLDEPVAGLDPVATDEMYGIVKSLNENENITIIMISHDIKSAVLYAKHILHLGDDVFFGTTEEYLNSNAGKIYAALVGGEQNDSNI